MGEAQKGRSLNIGGEMEHGHHEHDHHRHNLYLDIFPRDLLNRFMASSSDNRSSSSTNLSREDEGDADEEEFELNLGLSLGGRFGIDEDKKKLTRSSSIASTLPIVRDDNGVMTSAHFNYPTLVKTSSLPTEREEEWRKRKELQTWRRMEAKRRRSEKQRKVDRASALTVGGISDKSLEEEERRERDGNINLRDNKQHVFLSTATNKFDSPFGLPSWITAGRDSGNAELKGKGGYLGGSSSFQRSGQQPNSQGSVESQGGNSSGVSEFETKPVQGVRSGGEARSSGCNPPLQVQGCPEVGSSGTNPFENTSRTLNKGKEIGTNAMEDMPCVFTKGDGPNGRRVDGILYKYGKGEEVKIMCVCHGTFLSPAEFVKHAGGSDVEHPLRHIVVNPSAPSLK